MEKYLLEILIQNIIFVNLEVTFVLVIFI